MNNKEDVTEEGIMIIVDEKAPDGDAAADYIDQTQDLIDQVVSKDQIFISQN